MRPTPGFSSLSSRPFGSPYRLLAVGFQPPTSPQHAQSSINSDSSSSTNGVSTNSNSAPKADPSLPRVPVQSTPLRSTPIPLPQSSASPLSVIAPRIVQDENFILFKEHVLNGGVPLALGSVRALRLMLIGPTAPLTLLLIGVSRQRQSPVFIFPDPDPISSQSVVSFTFPSSVSSSASSPSSLPHTCLAVLRNASKAKSVLISKVDFVFTDSASLSSVTSVASISNGTPAVLLPPGASKLTLPGLIGRDQEAGVLSASLPLSVPVPGCKVALVTGIPAIGKSTLCYCLIHERMKRRCYPNGNVLILDCSSSTSLLVTLRRVAVHTLTSFPAEGKIVPDDQLCGVVAEWLKSHPGWLLLLDNLDHPPSVVDLLRQLLPSCMTMTGHVIITTRLPASHFIQSWPEVCPLAVQLELTPLDPHSASVLLRGVATLGPGLEADMYASLKEHSLPPNESQAMEWLCGGDGLGGLPLALQQAGASIHEQHISFLEYKQQIVEATPASLIPPLPSAHTLLSQPEFWKDFLSSTLCLFHHTVDDRLFDVIFEQQLLIRSSSNDASSASTAAVEYRTLLFSDRLQGVTNSPISDVMASRLYSRIMSLSPITRRSFYLLSLCAPEEIPGKFLLSAGLLTSWDEVATVCDELHRNSLISLHHQQPPDPTVSGVGKQQQPQPLVTISVHPVFQRVTQQCMSEEDLSQARRSALRSLLACIPRFISNGNGADPTIIFNGEFSSIRPHAASILEGWDQWPGVLEQQQGSGSGYVFGELLTPVISNWAQALFDSKYYEEADHIAHGLLEVRRQILGGDHELTLQCWLLWIRCMAALELTAEAESELTELLPLCRTSLGEQHPLTVETWKLWISALRKLDRTEEANTQTTLFNNGNHSSTT